MGIMVYYGIFSLLWVMQELYHQPYFLTGFLLRHFI